MWTEEAHAFDYGAEQAGKDTRALMEVEGEEIFWARLGYVCRNGLEVTISVIIRDWAFQSWKTCIFCIHDRFDIGWCHLEQSGVTILGKRLGWHACWRIRRSILYCSSSCFGRNVKM